MEKIQQNKTYKLLTDGGARGNPGPAGAGGVILDEDGKQIAKISEYLGVLTNNQAEYQSLILGLDKAKKLGIKKLDCLLDSELVVKQLNGQYRVKSQSIKEHYGVVERHRKNFQKITFKHILRHKNKSADLLVNEAIDKVSKRKR